MSADTGSNRLPELAAQIRLAHDGVNAAAKLAAEHAIAAGIALIEAKKLLRHGQWLPWLKEHCQLSERSAQLYMKIVRLGLKSETVADLGIKAAGTVIAELPHPNNAIWAECSEELCREWHLFAWFIVIEDRADPEGVFLYIEWLQRQGFADPDDWLGAAAYRRAHRWGERTAECNQRWAAFKAERTESLDEIVQKLQAASEALPVRKPRRRRA